jgi:hypothetical protein
MRGAERAREDRRMSDATFQTVRLRRGVHASPDDGACVVELASMLAGERFSDHPRSVCPVIAGFLRVYNDRVDDRSLAALHPLASMVVGSAASRSVRRRRLRHLAAWTEAEDPRRAAGRFPTRAEVVEGAAYAAAGLDPARRTPAVEQLVAELVAIGDARPAVAVVVPAEAETVLAAGATTSA